VVVGGYFKLNYHRLLMVIGRYFIGGYWWISVVISGYFINGYWWLNYHRLLVAIILVDIVDYYM
jgi:hypothetical protein